MVIHILSSDSHEKMCSVGTNVRALIRRRNITELSRSADMGEKKLFNCHFNELTPVVILSKASALPDEWTNEFCRSAYGRFPCGAIEFIEWTRSHSVRAPLNDRYIVAMRTFRRKHVPCRNAHRLLMHFHSLLFAFLVYEKQIIDKLVIRLQPFDHKASVTHLTIYSPLHERSQMG